MKITDLARNHKAVLRLNKNPFLVIVKYFFNGGAQQE